MDCCYGLFRKSLTHCSPPRSTVPDLQLHGLTQQLTPHSGEVIQCRYYDNGSKVVSCSHNSIKLWKAETGEVLATLPSDTNWITDCAISENGQVLVSCSDDCTCKVLYVGGTGQTV